MWWGMGMKKKCSRSTEPKWLESRGHLGPGGCRGDAPLGKVTLTKKNLGIWETSLLYRNQEKKKKMLTHQNQHFITFPIIPTIQTAKLAKFINFLSNTFNSMCAWAMIYQTIRAENRGNSSSTNWPKVMSFLWTVYEKASWKCCACSQHSWLL